MHLPSFKNVFILFMIVLGLFQRIYEFKQEKKHKLKIKLKQIMP